MLRVERATLACVPGICVSNRKTDELVRDAWALWDS